MFCPLFFSTIVCDLIFDCGSYLQFAIAHDDNDGGDGDDDGDGDDPHLHCSGEGRVGRREDGREAGGNGANFDVASITWRKTFRAAVS